MHNIPLSCISSPSRYLYVSCASYGLVQATVGAGTVLIWDFCAARTGGGEGTLRGSERSRRVTTIVDPWPSSGVADHSCRCFAALLALPGQVLCVMPSRASQGVGLRTLAALGTHPMLNSFVLCCNFCACKCACTVVMRSPGGGRGTVIWCVPQGVVGDRLPWGGERQGGGRVLKMLRFFRGFQICQRHVEQLSAHLLPTSDFIPRIECWGPSAGGYMVRSFCLCRPLSGSSREQPP